MAPCQRPTSSIRPAFERSSRLHRRARYQRQTSRAHATTCASPSSLSHFSTRARHSLFNVQLFDAPHRRPTPRVVTAFERSSNPNRRAPYHRPTSRARLSNVHLFDVRLPAHHHLPFALQHLYLFSGVQLFSIYRVKVVSSLSPRALQTSNSSHRARFRTFFSPISPRALSTYNS